MTFIFYEGEKTVCRPISASIDENGFCNLPVGECGLIGLKDQVTVLFDPCAKMVLLTGRFTAKYALPLELTCDSRFLRVDLSPVLKLLGLTMEQFAGDWELRPSGEFPSALVINLHPMRGA